MAIGKVSNKVFAFELVCMMIISVDDETVAVCSYENVFCFFKMSSSKMLPM